MNAAQGTDKDPVFIDRDQKPFETMISYLRNELQVYPHFDTIHEELYFAGELEYWGIPNQ